MLHEDMLGASLKELAKALYFLKTGEEYQGDISIDFDDTIIEDEQQKKNNAILELNNGLIDNVQYYQDIYGMSEKQAIKFDKKIRDRKAEQEKENKAPGEEETDEEDNEPFLNKKGNSEPENKPGEETEDQKEEEE